MQKFVPINFTNRSQILYISSSKLLLTSVNLGFSALFKNIFISPRPNEAFIILVSIRSVYIFLLVVQYSLIKGPIKGAWCQHCAVSWASLICFSDLLHKSTVLWNWGSYCVLNTRSAVQIQLPGFEKMKIEFLTHVSFEVYFS